MHIEPGFIAASKVVVANVAVVGVLGAYIKELIAEPSNIAKTVFAPIFFSLFMQSFHMSVGPSELHFIGAMPVYMILGFIPTMFGFALGLLFQGFMFEPQDLPHLAVNSLSLIMPLIMVHYSIGKDIFDIKLSKRVNVKTILKFDAIYYSGVVTMVGFWLFLGYIDGLVSNSFAEYLTFVSSYLAVVAFEPFFTYLILNIAKKYQHISFMRLFTQIDSLKLASEKI